MKLARRSMQCAVFLLICTSLLSANSIVISQTDNPTFLFASGVSISKFQIGEESPENFSIPIVSGVEVLLAHEESDLLIWCDSGIGSGKIYASSLNGENFRTVLQTDMQEVGRHFLPKRILDIAYDPLASMIYWVEENSENGIPAGTTVKKSSIDGSQRETVFDEVTNARSIELDPFVKMIYWVDSSQRAHGPQLWWLLQSKNLFTWHIT